MLAEVKNEGADVLSCFRIANQHAERALTFADLIHQRTNARECFLKLVGGFFAESTAP